MALKNKTILIISPQAWGNMFLAKHHYAIALANQGNVVYFLNPPQSEKITEQVCIKKLEQYPNLSIIHHSLKFPYQIKFKWIGLFHFLMQFHVKRIIKKIEKPIDIIWSFDLGHYYPFKYFPKKSFKIFNPVDEPLTKDAIKSAEGADVIFSVTKEILEKYHRFKGAKHFIHHGLADEFLLEDNYKKNNDVIRVGMSGNWLRLDVDHSNLLKIIQDNPLVVFELWGTYKIKDSNIGGEKNTIIDTFICELQNCKNVVLHGAVNTKILAKEFQRMDAFLICYDIQKDQSKGTNYHKVMEYLSTGKVVISNNISTYSSLPDLIEMTNGRENNEGLSELFKKVVQDLSLYNSLEKQNKRKDFAFANTYTNLLKKMEDLIS